MTVHRHLPYIVSPRLHAALVYNATSDPTYTFFHLLDPLSVLADRKKYLTDESGLETTPFLELANNQRYPPDTLNLTELDHRVLSPNAMTEKQKIEEAAYTGFMRAHGIVIKKHEESKEASKEVLRSLAKRKEMIGPGIDRGGCTLVNEAFRETFEQNPGIRRVVGRND